MTITVLDETKVVGGVKTRVVEERETRHGRLAELSRNYFAIDRTTKDIYYFGENVDTYEDGRVSRHEGAWMAGMNGARFGLVMPAKPQVGDRYYQELAPGVAMDRAEIISLTEEHKLSMGSYKDCLRTRESSALEGGSEDKWYAPGVGLIQDASFLLVRIEKGRP